MLEEPDVDESFTDQEHMHASFRMDAPFMKSLTEEPYTPLSTNEEKQEEEEEKEETPSPKQRQGSLLKKTLLKTFSDNEERTVLKVLKVIDNMEERHAKQGFKEINFTAGVMNCFFVAYMFGAHPEHFWLVYLVESFWFIPRKFRNMVSAKPLNQALYYFDFCWMMNFNAIFSLVCVASPIPLPPAFRKAMFKGSFGIACGPLLGATLMLPFVAFVFHDLNTMTNVIIHALPPMLLYTMRWHPDEIREAWPQIFHLKNLEEVAYFPGGGINPFFVPGTGLNSIAGNAVLIYMLWWIPYTSWMLIMGLDMPRKNKKDGAAPKYDTVFHSFWRAGSCQSFGTMLWKRPVELSKKQMENDDYEVRDFMVYMGIHAVMVLLSIPTLGAACHYSKATHMAVMLVVLLAVVHRGSVRYTYYTTKMYGRLIRKEFLSDGKFG